MQVLYVAVYTHLMLLHIHVLAVTTLYKHNVCMVILVRHRGMILTNIEGEDQSIFQICPELHAFCNSGN